MKNEKSIENIQMRIKRHLWWNSFTNQALSREVFSQKAPKNMFDWVLITILLLLSLKVAMEKEYLFSRNSKKEANKENLKIQKILFA